MVCSLHQPLSPALQWPVSEPAPSSKSPLQTTFGSVAAKAGSVALPARNTTAAAASWESFIGTSPWLAASRNDGCSVFRSANEEDVPPLPFLDSCRRGLSACLSGNRGQAPPFQLRPRTRAAGRTTCGGSPPGTLYAAIGVLRAWQRPVIRHGDRRPGAMATGLPPAPSADAMRSS